MANIKEVLDIVCCLLFFKKISTQKLEVILGYDTAWKSLGVLSDMHSLLHIPDVESNEVDNDPANHFIGFYYVPPLQKFLFDLSRAKNLYINPKEASKFVVNCIIKHFKGVFKIIFKVYF